MCVVSVCARCCVMYVYVWVHFFFVCLIDLVCLKYFCLPVNWGIKTIKKKIKMTHRTVHKKKKIRWEANNRVYGRTSNPYDLDRTPGKKKKIKFSPLIVFSKALSNNFFHRLFVTPYK